MAAEPPGSVADGFVRAEDEVLPPPPAPAPARPHPPFGAECISDPGDGNDFFPFHLDFLRCFVHIVRCGAPSSRRVTS